MDMQKVKETVGRCRTTLLRYKQDREHALNNPLVNDWLRVDSRDLPAIARQFGITADLTTPRKRFRELVETIPQRLAGLENELGSLTADLSFKTADPARMLGIAEQIEKKCTDLAPQLDLLRSLENTFCEADKTLREKLQLRNLINAVPVLLGASTNFDLGLRVLQCVSAEAASEDRQAAMQDILLRANRLAERLRGITLPEPLPPIAQRMLTEQISRVIEAADLIGDYVEYIDRHLSDLFPAVKSLEQTLRDLKQEPVAKVFHDLPELIKRCSTVVATFQKYDKIPTAVERLESLLGEIKLFRISLKGNLIQDFYQTTLAGGALSPASFAHSFASRYFAGLAGLIRMCRFLLGALAGRRMLTEQMLDHILASALTRFPRHDSDQEQEKTLAEDIDQELLADFTHPFPYQELHQLVLKMLKEYAAAVQADFNRRPVSFPEEGQERATPSADQSILQGSAPLTVAKFISRIEVRAENLHGNI